MPDILIRGLELPTAEQAYKTLIVSCDGKVYEGVHPQPTAKKTERIAQAVELPAHGDLIDRDRLLEDGWVLHKEVIRMGGYAIHELPLSNPGIPVIVPASEEVADENP